MTSKFNCPTLIDLLSFTLLFPPFSLVSSSSYSITYWLPSLYVRYIINLTIHDGSHLFHYASHHSRLHHHFLAPSLLSTIILVMGQQLGFLQRQQDRHHHRQIKSSELRIIILKEHGKIMCLKKNIQQEMQQAMTGLEEEDLLLSLLLIIRMPWIDWMTQWVRFPLITFRTFGSSLMTRIIKRLKMQLLLLLPQVKNKFRLWNNTHETSPFLLQEQEELTLIRIRIGTWKKERINCFKKSNWFKIPELEESSKDFGQLLHRISLRILFSLKF